MNRLPNPSDRKTPDRRIARIAAAPLAVLLVIAAFSAKSGLLSVPPGFAAAVASAPPPLIPGLALAGVGTSVVLAFLTLRWRRRHASVVRDRDATTARLVRETLRYQTILASSGEGVHVVDDKGSLVEANGSFLIMLGYPNDRLPTLCFADWDTMFSYQHVRDRVRAQAGPPVNLLTRHRCADGRQFDAEVSYHAVEIDGRDYLYGFARDITQRKAAEDEIEQLAFYDPLTGLPNRRLLVDRLKQALASSTRSGREGALLLIDLDNFKTLNDTLGHANGDQLLQEVAARLATCVREGDTVARLGGDEYVVMLEDLSERMEEAASQSEAVAEKILAAIQQPYAIAGQDTHSTASIGATLFQDHQESVDELLKRTDLAMDQAKSNGRNTICFFEPGLQAAVKTRAALEADLRRGIREDQLLLYYQPQMDGDGCLIGAEALVRWRHPQRGLISPAEFIPLAEETGLILPLGRWVLETACRQIVRWSQRPETAALSLAVNVSARQFHEVDFVDQVIGVLTKTGADPRKLKLELTESMLLDNVEDIIAKMTALKKWGLNFSLDDFGTGYSSLSYLKRLPLRQLKIDQSFVRDVLTDANDAAIARTIIALAQSLSLSVIAEGVETEGQRAFLACHGCHAYQGYLYSRPLPLEEFRRFVVHPPMVIAS